MDTHYAPYAVDPAEESTCNATGQLHCLLLDSKFSVMLSPQSTGLPQPAAEAGAPLLLPEIGAAAVAPSSCFAILPPVT